MTAPEPRRPICADCRGQGVTNQPRAMLLREPADSETLSTEPHGSAGRRGGRAEMTSTLAAAKCQACRGTGKAGTP